MLKDLVVIGECEAALLSSLHKGLKMHLHLKCTSLDLAGFTSSQINQSQAAIPHEVNGRQQMKEPLREMQERSPWPQDCQEPALSGIREVVPELKPWAPCGRFLIPQGQPCC